MPLLAWDGALPPPSLAALRSGFHPSAPFWREHAYWSGDTPFFSYLMPDLCERSVQQQQQHPLEALLLQLRQELLAATVHAYREDEGSMGTQGVGLGFASEAGRLMREATHAEWWAHCRPADAPHQLHFDLGE
jgi:hypothetical protein